MTKFSLLHFDVICRASLQQIVPRQFGPRLAARPPHHGVSSYWLSDRFRGGWRRGRRFRLFASRDRLLFLDQGLDRQQPGIAKDDLIVLISVSTIADD